MGLEQELEPVTGALYAEAVLGGDGKGVAREGKRNSSRSRASKSAASRSRSQATMEPVEEVETGPELLPMPAKRKITSARPFRSVLLYLPAPDQEPVTAADLYEAWVQNNPAAKALHMMHELSLRRVLRHVLIFLRGVSVETAIGMPIVEEPRPHLWRLGGAGNAALYADIDALEHYFFDKKFTILAPYA